MRWLTAMGELVLDLVPLAAGIILSPLAIMALVAVLLSDRARVNGVMYLIGWALAITVVLIFSYSVLGSLKPEQSLTTPVWVTIVRLLVGLLLIATGVWEYRKGRAVLRQMAVARTPTEVVAAAPQLPGWLQTVSTFTTLRSFALGFGIFALNPVDLSCALIAGIDIRSAPLPDGVGTWLLVIFGLVGLLPILVPVGFILVVGRRAEPFLGRARNWIASHNGVLSAALLLVIGALQLQKGLTALVT